MKLFSSTTSYIKPVLLGVGVGILIVSTFLYVYGSPESVSAKLSDMHEAEPPKATYLRESPVPIRVSGVVQATDHVTVYAQAAGVVTTLPAREGALVSRGDLLAIQATPVTDAQFAQVSAEGRLQSLEQAQSLGVRTLQADQARTRALSANEIALLRAMSNEHRLAEVSTALHTVLEEGVLTITNVVNYIQNNRTLFSAEGMSLYTDVVRALYGEIPTQFRSSVIIPMRDEVGIASMIREAYETEDRATLQSASLRIQEQLATLIELLLTGERDIFERNSSFVTPAMRVEYTEQRTAVLQALQAIQSVDAQFIQVVDNALEDATSQQTNVAVGDLDEELALMQAQYAERLARQSDVVSDAALGVVAAEQALARPRAPFSGSVARVLVDEGEYVTPGTPLLSLVGNGAREVVVSVPVHLLSGVTVGQPLLRGDDPIGQVARVSQVADGGSGIVIVTLDTTYEMRVGSAVSGTLSFEHGGVFAVPRLYVFFDNDGPYITYANGEVSRVSVVYDTGSVLYVEVSHVLDQPLRRAHSVSL